MLTIYSSDKVPYLFTLNLYNAEAVQNLDQFFNYCSCEVNPALLRNINAMQGQNKIIVCLELPCLIEKIPADKILLVKYKKNLFYLDIFYFLPIINY